MAESALEALASCEPAQLADARTLSSLHARCAAAGLCPALPASDAAACLHALFDVALHNGLACLVVHYVQEACRHTLAAQPPASPDARAVRSVWTRWPCPATPRART